MTLKEETFAEETSRFCEFLAKSRKFDPAKDFISSHLRKFIPAKNVFQKFRFFFFYSESFFLFKVLYVILYITKSYLQITFSQSFYW